MPKGLKLSIEIRKLLFYAESYGRIIDRLLCLALTRAYISGAVFKLIFTNSKRKTLQGNFRCFKVSQRDNEQRFVCLKNSDIKVTHMAMRIREYVK